MNRDFVREYEEEAELPVGEKIKIGVLGINKNNGSSFIATSLAKTVAEQKKYSTAFVELKEGISSEPLIYDSMAMDKRFANRQFTPFYTLLKDKKSIKNVYNMDEGINWALLSPDERDRGIYLTSVEKLRLLNNIAADVVICDIDDKEDLEDILPELDKIIAVIDPMPAKLLSGQKILKQMKKIRLDGREKKEERLVWIINKYNGGIHKKRAKDFIKIKDCIKIPLIKSEYIYTAEYNCKLPYMQKEIKKQVKKAMEEIVNYHIIIT